MVRQAHHEGLVLSLLIPSLSRDEGRGPTQASTIVDTSANTLPSQQGSDAYAGTSRILRRVAFLLPSSRAPARGRGDPAADGLLRRCAPRNDDPGCPPHRTVLQGPA